MGQAPTWAGPGEPFAGESRARKPGAALRPSQERLRVCAKDLGRQEEEPPSPNLRKEQESWKEPGENQKEFPHFPESESEEGDIQTRKKILPL